MALLRTGSCCGAAAACGRAQLELQRTQRQQSGDWSDESGEEAGEAVPFEQLILPPRPMPQSFAVAVRPQVPRGCHWATMSPELPEDTDHLVFDSFASTPWSQLQDKDNEVHPAPDCMLCASGLLSGPARSLHTAGPSCCHPAGSVFWLGSYPAACASLCWATLHLSQPGSLQQTVPGRACATPLHAEPCMRSVRRWCS